MAAIRQMDRNDADIRSWIVVPCYNEEARFQRDAFQTYLASQPQIGFILVNDGSRDGTLTVLRSLEASWPGQVMVVDQQPNQGKAEAVRVGILRALAMPSQYVGFFDADLATPLDAIAEFVRTLDEYSEIDLVLGSRVALLGRYIERKPVRHYLGRVFATAASVVLALPVYDTQCGAKLFRASPVTRQLFERPFRSRWIFDVEMIARYLVVAQRKDGIYELPLRRWTDVGDSRVKPTDFLRAVGELATIYRTYHARGSWLSLSNLLSAPFVRYVGAGGVGTVGHYLILAAVVELLAVSAPIATVIGALFGAAVNYGLNYHFTFASTSPHRQTLPKFLLIAALSVALNGVGMWYLVSRRSMYYLFAQVFCTVGVLLIGYVLNKVWTFAQPRAAK